MAQGGYDHFIISSEHHLLFTFAFMFSFHSEASERFIFWNLAFMIATFTFDGTGFIDDGISSTLLRFSNLEENSSGGRQFSLLLVSTLSSNKKNGTKAGRKS